MGQSLHKRKSLTNLFLASFCLSAFTFGGGYVIVSLMKKRFVDDWHWLEEEEMLDLVAIAQSSPGAIAINGAIVLGYQVYGILGIFVSIAGTILPPFTLLNLIALSYQSFSRCIYINWLLEGMQAGVAAVIASVVFDMGSSILHSDSLLLKILMLLAFLANYCFNISLVFILLSCLGLSLILYWKEKSHTLP
ncbi:chromate transporter [Atopobacter sp. AH10]|uniref:chromate transporter n=1 Tax=Atopobacter sp. AH10 TaxID=2315861 RepID=UPI000EF20B25|nr:chromate transporter [Atopobacter sp. AH10]RLK64261.1 chromate transporter [Atopobacter sp. AH10]